jgi:hypothetical protein
MHLWLISISFNKIIKLKHIILRFSPNILPKNFVDGFNRDPGMNYYIKGYIH